MQININPISAEMWAKAHLDDLQQQANHYRVARQAAQACKNIRSTQATPRRPSGWLRLLVARLTGA